MDRLVEFINEQVSGIHQWTGKWNSSMDRLVEFINGQVSGIHHGQVSGIHQWAG